MINDKVYNVHNFIEWILLISYSLQIFNDLKPDIEFLKHAIQFLHNYFSILMLFSLTLHTEKSLSNYFSKENITFSVNFLQVH